MDKNTTIDRFIAFLLRTIVLAEITPASSIFLILFQQGVDEIPILFEISDKGKPEFFWIIAKIFLSILSIKIKTQKLFNQTH